MNFLSPIMCIRISASALKIQIGNFMAVLIHGNSTIAKGPARNEKYLRKKGMKKSLQASSQNLRN
jgi:hypothetical protein